MRARTVRRHGRGSGLSGYVIAPALLQGLQHARRAPRRSCSRWAPSPARRTAARSRSGSRARSRAARILLERWIAGALALVAAGLRDPLTIPWLLDLRRRDDRLPPALALVGAPVAASCSRSTALTFLLLVPRPKPTWIAVAMLAFDLVEFAIYMIKILTHWSRASARSTSSATLRDLRERAPRLESCSVRPTPWRSACWRSLASFERARRALPSGGRSHALEQARELARAAPSGRAPSSGSARSRAPGPRPPRRRARASLFAPRFLQRLAAAVGALRARSVVLLEDAQALERLGEAAQGLVGLRQGQLHPAVGVLLVDPGRALERRERLRRARCAWSRARPRR